MKVRLDRFEDFHTYGASAPEWNQRYQQISRGTMHSAMTEIAFGGTHLFWKSLSQRVVQQGRLPEGKLCFAVPTRLAGSARMQGREVRDSSVFVLRGGDEFVMHRPAHMELLAVTVDEQEFIRFLDHYEGAAGLQASLRRKVLDSSPAALDELKARLSAMFIWGAGATEYALPSGSDVAMEGLIHAGLLAVLRGTGREPGRQKGLSAHMLVSECHRITMARTEEPPSVDELCTRLGTSRRSLQDSFRRVAGTTPVDYLRSMRLNLVRRMLQKTTSRHASIGDIAMRAGFSQMSHFAVEYRRLFGELPSRTARADTLGARPLSPRS